VNELKLNPRIVISIAGGVALIAASYIISRYPIDYSQFETYGYIGVFLATLLGSATIFFPMPNIATVFAAGMLFNPVWVAIAGGLGSAIGETIGYLIGLGGSTVEINSKWYSKVESWMQRYSGITIFILALIPNPFFDIAGILAGLMRYNFFKFFIATFSGKTLRSLILSYLGYQFI
jgi:membrane protein DedA with SNARE-associated domain